MSGAVRLSVAVAWLFCATLTTCGVDSQPTVADDSARCPKSDVDEEDRMKAIEEYQRLQRALQEERQRVKALESMLRDANQKKPDERGAPPKNLSVTLLKQLHPANFDPGRGVAIGRNEIYVMGEFSRTIRVFRDDAGFQQLRDISISRVNQPYDLVYSNKTNCLYIADFRDKCIWKLETANEINTLTVWLDGIPPMCTMSLTTNGNILLSQQSSQSSPNRLAIYDATNAELILNLRLPTTMLGLPQHAVQTAWGTFIVSHRKEENNREQNFLTQITNEGRIVNQFDARIADKEFPRVFYLCLDLSYELLLAADAWGHRIIVFDARALTMTQILTSTGDSVNDRPFRLLVDQGTPRRLFSQHWATRKNDSQWIDGRLDVYRLS